MSIKIEKK